MCLECGDDYYGDGVRCEGGGPLDNMRSMEQYLPNPNQSRPYSDQKGNLIIFKFAIKISNSIKNEALL